MKKKTLIVITGPTGVGKTETTIQIAEYFKAIILNADSRQLFSEIPIGTAAPTPIQQARVKHLFVGNLKLTDYYSASKYEHDVIQYMKQTLDPITILSGGSMMYIDAVCKGIDEIPTVLPQIRKSLTVRLAQEGLDNLCKELYYLDPEYYYIVDKKNQRRVLHALEICFQTGKPYSSFRTNVIKKRSFNIIKIGLKREREELYNRINQRVLKMIDDGLEKEVLRVYPYRYLNSLNTVGYKEMFQYVDGLTTLDETIFKIQSNSRRYARKQLTWLNKDNEIQWFTPYNIEGILNYITQKLNTLR